MTKTVDFEKHIELKKDAEKRAQEIHEYMQRNGVYGTIPANIDPFQGSLLEAAIKVIYENEVYKMKNEQPE